jgi:para-nitrobenzyl esterase
VPQRVPDVEGVQQDPLPVMVYFPAGEFLIGSSNDLENNWPFSQHVILVTANYRLGWLGYAALDALRHRSSSNATGNYGMEDQR